DDRRRPLDRRPPLHHPRPCAEGQLARARRAALWRARPAAIRDRAAAGPPSQPIRHRGRAQRHAGGIGSARAQRAIRLDRADGTAETATFRAVVGCDGAHSAVRRALGIPFEGEAFPIMFMLGDVHIDWDLPRGMALRALRLVENAPPDMFIAVPLPEPGRYRVSMLASPELAASGGSSHGIQSELPGPQLPQLQSVADGLLPEKPKLSDLRWSSIFRIS